MNRKDNAITRYELDPVNPPPLTARQQEALHALAVMPDTEIDYSDIPPAKSARYRPVKEMTTVRIDADVLVWLRACGKGYQTKINAILRREMLASQELEQR